MNLIVDKKEKVFVFKGDKESTLASIDQISQKVEKMYREV